MGCDGTRSFRLENDAVLVVAESKIERWACAVKAALTSCPVSVYYVIIALSPPAWWFICSFRLLTKTYHNIHFRQPDIIQSS